MPKCPVCKKSVRGSDKIKVRGVWQHHHSSVKKAHPKVVLKPRSEGMSTMVEEGLKFPNHPNVSRAWGRNPDGYSDEQLLRRALERN